VSQMHLKGYHAEVSYLLVLKRVIIFLGNFPIYTVYTRQQNINQLT
jgi:hypothetical protein